MAEDNSNDLASRILQRAQMAQMTRQLKLGLSQIPKNQINDDTPHATSTSNNNNNKRAGDNFLLKKETSPLKKQSTETSISTTNNNNPKNLNINKEKFNKNENKIIGPSSPSSNSPMKVMPSTPGRSTNTNNHRFLTTPNQKTFKKNNNGDNSSNSAGDDTGADLLMYLATSPYTKPSTSSSINQHKLNNFMKIPTTPSSSSYSNHHNPNDEAIRLSNMKPSLSSPQSTFKVPHLVAHNGTSSLAYQDVLMDSSSLYMNSMHTSNNGMSPQKKKMSPQQSQVPTAIPTTPSRESATTTKSGNIINGSTNNQRDQLGLPAGNNSQSNNNNSGTIFNNLNLLKTPNFNMGDYIHNLFSPSPNVSTSQASQFNNVAVGLNKTGMVNESASDAFNGLLAASSNKQQQSITTSTSTSALVDKTNNDL